MNRIAWLSLCITLATASPLLPCGFHNYAPQPTIVERMLASTSIVLAGQSPHSPFKFAVTEHLLGDIPEASIPFLVDGTTRRKFQSGSVSVLFAYEAETQTWTRLALIDDSIRPVLNDILDNLPAWREGATAERAQNFANLLAHPNPTIRNLALRELDLIGYDVLRNLSLTVETEAILRKIDSPFERDKVPIRVLLLGLSKDPSVASYLQKGVENNLSGLGPSLGAYATAWIELLGVEAVENVTRQYLTNSAAQPTAKRLMVEALALHRNYGDPAVSAAVSQEMSRAIQRDPSLATLAAQYFIGGSGGAKGLAMPSQRASRPAAPGN